MKLPRIVIPYEDETVRGVLTRLTERNGFPSPAVTAKILGISFHQMGTAISAVAKACEVPAAGLLRSSPCNQGMAAVHVAGQMLRAKQVSARARRWCPECLAERPSHRFCWDVSVISTCATHRTRLLDRCPSCENRLLWRNPSMTLCESCSYDLTRAPSTPALDDEIEADTYTLGRLGVLPPRPLLLADRIDLGDALSHLDRLGRLILGGYRVSAPSLEDLGVSGSGVLARGIAMVSDWPRAFHVCLDQVMLQSTTQRDSDAQGANWAYGWAYLWATKLPEDAFSRAIKRASTLSATRSRDPAQHTCP